MYRLRSSSCRAQWRHRGHTTQGLRPIIAKVLRWKDRETILQHVKLLKGSKIFFNEDFTDAVKRKRKGELKTKDAILLTPGSL